MCDALVWSLGAMRWPETISALAAVVTAAIAIIALQTWRYQDQAKIKAEFLDALIEAVHAYIAEMSAPITHVEIVKIGMTSHAPREKGEPTDIEVKGAVAYIQKNGKHEGKRLLEVLETVKSSVIKLRALAAKGQVFKFDDYAKCQSAVAVLTWQFDRIEALMAVIGWPTLNWENPEVLKHLRDVIALDSDEIRRSVQQSNVAILEFSRETYKQIYG